MEGRKKQEWLMTAGILKQDPNTQKVQKNGQENNIAEPKTDKWFSLPSHFSSFFFTV